LNSTVNRTKVSVKRKITISLTISERSVRWQNDYFIKADCCQYCYRPVLVKSNYTRQWSQSPEKGILIAEVSARAFAYTEKGINDEKIVQFIAAI